MKTGVTSVCPTISDPSAKWTARHPLEGIGTADYTTRFPLHDRDAIFGAVVQRQTAALGLREIITAARSPWQNAYVERVIGSIRREGLDHTIVIGERHLRRVAGRYVRYYNNVRTDLSVEKDAPVARSFHPPDLGPIVSRKHYGGLHHEYLRRAA